MDKTLTTTPAGLAAALTADKSLDAAEKAAVQAAVALVNPDVGNAVEVSVAVGDNGAWAVVRVAPFNKQA